MKIRKRNNSIVEFEIEKVTNAIYKACIEIDTSCDIDFAKDVAETVYSKCQAEPEPISVELIQDMIENELLNVDVRIAKKYIIYRDNKNKNRVTKKKYKHLSEEFLSKYKHKPDPLSQLGSFVFYRTYSRYLPEENRREYWWETIARAVDHNCKLAPNTTAKEAELLFDNIYNLKQQLSGRSLFTGGTEASYKYPLSGFNCSFTTIESIEDFCDLFYVLMVGTGVGVGIQSMYTDKLPLFRTDIKLFHEEWEFTAKPFREDITTTEVNGDTIKIIVGDSKEGFIEALRLFLSIMSSHSYRTIKNIIINYNFVRPKGERLVVFGGQASGYESMKNMLLKIHKLIGKKALPTGEKVKLKPIDVMDISNIIGENVVSGGVRRTSEIMFVDIDDIETQNAKNDLYYQTETGEWVANTSILHRMMSNNSIMYEEKPSKEQLHEHFIKMRYTGEPGIVVAPNARARRDNFKGLNPCAEILLDSKGVCNLTTTNMTAFITSTGELDLESLLLATRLSTRAGYRMTNLTLELDNWDRIQKRDRLLGVSMTGYQEMVSAIGMTPEEEDTLLELMRETIHAAMKEIAKELGGRESLLSTCVKPEGTLSQVFGGVSSGLHSAHSEYYIRRIRINSYDPLCKVAEELGWSVKIEVGQTEENCTTKVIELPVHSPAKRFKKDVTAIEQLEVYKRFQTHYTDHNSSITITVKNHEWEEVENWIWDNWGVLIGVSFLSEDDSFYQLMPYEEITKEQYEELKARTKPFSPVLLKKFETTGVSELDLDETCAEDGACAVR